MTIYFWQTGQTVTGAFLSYWMDHQEIGLPVGPHVQHGEHLTQWFEYARLEVRWVPFEHATDANIYKVELGREFANSIGYATRLDAFQPKAAGAERFFPDTGHSIQNGFRRNYEQYGMPERLGPPISDEFSVGPAVYQFFLMGAFSFKPSEGIQLVPLGTLDAGIHGRLGAPQPQSAGSIAFESLGGSIDMLTLSDMLVGERWIEVDLTRFELIAWVGDYEVLRSSVVTGSPYSLTPTGNFRIYLRYEIQDLSGIGWDGNPYYEANVPWVMYFFEDYAIHGTTWRTTFGYSDSQGCVIPPNSVGELLWDWSSYGTRVWVHY